MASRRACPGGLLQRRRGQAPPLAKAICNPLGGNSFLAAHDQGHPLRLRQRHRLLRPPPRQPAPAIYAAAREAAGCEPAEGVFIDDMSDNVAAAIALGWHGVVYTGCDDLRRRLAALGARLP